jgi:cellulose synthase/poly-beta-1,6-N-acetylglucosamine synthase-like glycosyltransferase/peptidoglycan/xylan/chitin deacetylase (PgdA/CDA1 family)
MIVLIFMIGLVIEGYTRGVLGENSADLAHAGGPFAPSSVLHSGPVINASGGRLRSYSMPRRTVALTFDDGPDPVWTPKILAILRRYRVPATFFLVGAHVASWPGIVRQEVADGDQVGSHTYTHANLSAAAWREGLELTLTQNALAGAAGVRTRLLRMPFSSEPDALTAREWRAAGEAGRDGYLVVLADLDTEDWARPGTAKIVAAAMPRGDRGAIVMFHDSGGNRAQTVAALPDVITRLRARGYRFTTVTGGLGLPAGDVPATARQRLVGNALVLSQQIADHSIALLAILLVIASALIVTRLFLLVGFAAVHKRRFGRAPPPAKPTAAWPGARVPGAPGEPAWMPGVSVVVPAYNEEAGIAATVRSMTASRYPGPIEVVVVDDGSSDGTADIVRRLGLPGVRLVRQANAGKPAALNHGIAVARHHILILVDGDTVFQPDTIMRLVSPMRAADVGAVSGNTKVGNRAGILGRWQHVEYVMGFNLDRRMFDILGTIPTVPGAIGAFRRSALAAVGWLSDETLAEDTDLTMALCRSPWRVIYEPAAIAWTEAPASLRQLWRQRYRWCYGTMQAMWKHKRALAERGQSGRFGRRCLTYLLLYHVLLPLIAPVVDVFSIYGLVFLNPVKVTLFWLTFVLLQLLAGGYALWLDRERLRSLWVLPLQQLVYRQLLYLVTIHSVITALLGTRQRWQVIKRAGVFEAGPVLPVAPDEIDGYTLEAEFPAGYGPVRAGRGSGPPAARTYGPPQPTPYGPPRQYGPPPDRQYGPPPDRQYGPPPDRQYGPPPDRQYGPPPPDRQYGPPQPRPYGPPTPYGQAEPREYGPPPLR